ncbi:MAG: hypothetical protein IKP31_03980 [Lachnospiraceae bacterium]|nr:hypothetical protein [Lachnospiraceae bacterium]
MSEELNVQNASLSDAIDKVMRNFEKVNALYVSKIAEQIKRVGKLTPSNVNRIILMTEWGLDINNITRQLAEATELTVKQVMVVFQKVLDDTFTDPRFEKALRHTQLTPDDEHRINRIAQAMSLQTAGQIVNLSNTTIVEQGYRDTLDKAIVAVQSGLSDYQSATRDVVRELGYNGLQVQYPSGYHRRLDTAVRQNIIDGTNQLAQQASDAVGEALGYDAYEITAHANSAPDHEPIQGHVFLKAEFEKLQSEQSFMDTSGNTYTPIRRAIGQWNCKHFAMSFSTEYSKRKWTDEQLKKFIDDNNKGCEIEGKHYTMYGVTQLMRKIETEARREKEAAIAARMAGDEVLQRECQTRINALRNKYKSVCQISGLDDYWVSKARVDGFKSIKV